MSLQLTGQTDGVSLLTPSNASHHLQVIVELRITEHTELGSNDSIKNPSQSSRSARKQERAQ